MRRGYSRAKVYSQILGVAWPAIVEQVLVMTVGIVSRGASGCSQPVYTRVDSWSDWIREMATRAVAAGRYDAPAWVTPALPESARFGDACRAYGGRGKCFKGNLNPVADLLQAVERDRLRGAGNARPVPPADQHPVPAAADIGDHLAGRDAARETLKQTAYPTTIPDL